MNFAGELGLDKLAGQGAAGESNDLNVSKLLDEADEEEWGRSIFDVRHVAEEPPSSDPLQDYIIEEVYDDEANSTSSAVVTSTSNTTVISLTTSPIVISSNYAQTLFSLGTGSDGIEDVEGAFGEDDPDGRIDFDSFIDIAAFGRHAFTPSPSELPASTESNERRATMNPTTNALSDITPTPPSGILELLIRFGLATDRNHVMKAKATSEGHLKNAITTGTPVAIELDDEGYDWPVLGSLHRDSAKATDQYRGRVTLGHFRMPLVRDANESTRQKHGLRTHGAVTNRARLLASVNSSNINIPSRREHAVNRLQ
ncbi:hypothetical protein MTO96_038593 [Rhipicephalus appendiculatus]